MKLQSVTKYIFFILVTLVNHPAAAQAASEVQMDRARELYDSKKYEEAAAFCEKLLKDDYKNTYLLNQCGLSYFQQGKYEKARDKFRLATLYCPPGDKTNMGLYYSNLSASYDHTGNREKAYENALKAYQLDNNNLWNAASMAQNAGKYEECLKLMDKAGKDNLHIAYQTLYGRCYYHTKRYREAADSYRRFFSEYDPRDEFVTLDTETEANYFLYACLFNVAAETDEKKIDTAIAEIKKIIGKSGTKVSRENMMKGFAQPDNICSKYSFSAGTCAKIFKIWIDNPTAGEQMQFTYYALKDYPSAFRQSEYLVRSGENQKAKEIYYLSSLRLFLEDYFQNSRKADLKKLDMIAGLFKGVISKKNDTDSGLPPRVEDDETAMETFRIFNEYFKSREEQREAAALLIVIMENLPDERAKTEVMKILKAGYISN